MQTCRRFKDILSTKSIWLSLIRDLDIDHAPDLPYHIDLDSLSLEDLKMVTLRAIRGHSNWTSGKGPVVTNEVLSVARCQDTPARVEHEHPFIALIRNRYAILSLSNDIKCWDTQLETTIATIDISDWCQSAWCTSLVDAEDAQDLGAVGGRGTVLRIAVGGECSSQCM